MSVFVLDRRKNPLMPCSQKRARQMLQHGRARVHKLIPFTIRLVDRFVEDSVLQSITVKLDPGARTTGIALVRVDGSGDDAVHHVLHLAEVEHRGKAIKTALHQRANYRRGRRSRNLRYRPARFNNRTKPKGWLPPSLQHRVDTTTAWVSRYRRLTSVSAIAMELVRFDTHGLSSPEVAEQGGTAYQQGELAGYEVREYLLEKWGRQCAYCDDTKVPLQIEHIIARSRDGSDRVSNLTLACEPCNQKKNAQRIEDFLAHDQTRLARIKAGLKKPLDGAAAMNSTRCSLWRTLKDTGLPVECATGGRTKWNRSRLEIPKTHALDAACVGKVRSVQGWKCPVLDIRCTGRGSYQRTRTDKFGFPRGYLMRHKRVRGFATGDMVRAVVAKGVNAGIWTGRVAVRATGSFDIQTVESVRQGVNWKNVTLLQRGDGYAYTTQTTARHNS